VRIDGDGEEVRVSEEVDGEVHRLTLHGDEYDGEEAGIDAYDGEEAGIDAYDGEEAGIDAYDGEEEQQQDVPIDPLQQQQQDVLTELEDEDEDVAKSSSDW
jgi:hypothetical protein